MKYDTDSCLVMARSFLTEWALNNNASKKNFSAVYELNNNIAKLIVKKYRSKDVIEKKITVGATKVLDQFNKFTNNKEIQCSNLALGVGFVHLLVEQDCFVGSQALYFKRVSNDVYDYCERKINKTEVINATKLIDAYDRFLKGEPNEIHFN